MKLEGKDLMTILHATQTRAQSERIAKLETNAVQAMLFDLQRLDLLDVFREMCPEHKRLTLTSVRWGTGLRREDVKRQLENVGAVDSSRAALLRLLSG